VRAYSRFSKVMHYPAKVSDFASNRSRGAMLRPINLATRCGE